jgi:sterol desaturase/sphingolipid hydroxylase (fatty acid hydroxylase superfamily)
VGPVAQGFIAYGVATVVYYFWHRVRHESRLFWRLCHQLHHSPRRIEVVTAFYKHPVEALLNGLLSSTIVFAVLGCGPAGAALYTLLAAAAEFFYHSNLRTPAWVGYLVQRPEAHRVHHRRRHHAQNYADLPILDIAFGTFCNPERREPRCGFDAWREDRFEDLLAFRDVHAADAARTSPLHLLPTCIGCRRRWACQRGRAEAHEEAKV